MIYWSDETRLERAETAEEGDPVVTAVVAMLKRLVWRLREWKHEQLGGYLGSPALRFLGRKR